jgi:Na+-translocating ferredoxin:NAD+ oxidoreductase RnfC subunit
MIVLKSKRRKSHPHALIVKDGENVEAGQPLTEGSNQPA